MNLIEAVKALKEGRCKGIKNEYIRKDAVYDFSDNGMFVKDDSPVFVGFNIILSEDWELVNEVKEFKEVEITGYYCTKCGVIRSYLGNCCNKQLIQMKGVDKQEIKPKVKRRMQVGKVKHFIGNFENIPQEAFLIAEWEE